MPSAVRHTGRSLQGCEMGVLDTLVPKEVEVQDREGHWHSLRIRPYRTLENKIDGSEASFTAGVLLGYNYQVDRVVLGMETDFNYLGFSDSNTGGLTGEFSDYTTKSSFDANWFGTIRGRLGYAFDNLLIYGTGGLAYGHMSADGKVVQDDAGTLTTWKGSTETTNWGWTVGGGAEYGIDNWSLGLEYLYVDLGSAEWDSNVIDSSQLRGDVDYAFSTLRASVKYRFR